MTVPATPRRAGPFNGTGSTTAFGFNFKAFDAADVRVVVLDLPTSVESDAILNSDYTVALNPDQESNPGGTVNYLVAPPVTKRITLIGDLNYEQPIDLPDGGGYRAQQVEDALDRVAIQMQQLKEITDRCAKVSVSSQDTSTLFDSINTLAANIAVLQVVVANIAELLVLAMNIDDVNTVVLNLADVIAVAEEIPNLNLKVSKDSDTGAAFMPRGTTAQRPASPQNGYTRYNTTLQTLESYNAATSAWAPAGQGATGAVGNPMFYENDQIMTGDYTIAGTKNAHATGPIQIANGVTLTVASGATLVVA